MWSRANCQNLGTHQAHRLSLAWTYQWLCAPLVTRAISKGEMVFLEEEEGRLHAIHGCCVGMNLQTLFWLLSNSPKHPRRVFLGDVPP